jgi:hypothetical protein
VVIGGALLGALAVGLAVVRLRGIVSQSKCASWSISY